MSTDVSVSNLMKATVVSSAPEQVDGGIDTSTRLVELQTNEMCSSSISSEVDALTDELFLLQLSNNRLAFIEEELNSNLALATHELQRSSKWKESLETELASSESAISLERKREAMMRKAKELHAELERTMEGLNQPPITITQLLKQKDNVLKKEEELKLKRAKLKAFQGLPPNLELASHELAQAREELRKLIQLRERLLGSMADSVS